MKNKNKFLLTFITIIILLTSSNITNANEDNIEVFSGTFIENTDKDENWEYLYWANLQLNWYYFYKTRFEDFINKKVEVTVKWNENETFEILDTKIIKELSYYQNHQLYFLIHNVKELSNENKKKLIKFSKTNKISLKKLLISPKELTYEEKIKTINFVNNENVTIIIQ